MVGQKLFCPNFNQSIPALEGASLNEPNKPSFNTRLSSAKKGVRLKISNSIILNCSKMDDPAGLTNSGMSDI